MNFEFKLELEIEFGKKGKKIENKKKKKRKESLLGPGRHFWPNLIPCVTQPTFSRGAPSLSVVWANAISRSAWLSAYPGIHRPVGPTGQSRQLPLDVARLGGLTWTPRNSPLPKPYRASLSPPRHEIHRPGSST
jgi:hypothetical protein